MSDNPAQYSKVQRRLLTAAGGLGVAALTAATFVLTYADLRALAIQGGAARHRAYLYPGMVDGLLFVVILSILTARRSRWISRALRWLLLVVLVAGGGTAGVEHALHGYGRLARSWVSGGVAVAPWAILLIALWLWQSMIKQLLGLRVRRGDPGPESAPTVFDQEIVPGFTDRDPEDTVALPRPAAVRELPAAPVPVPETVPSHAGLSMEWLDPAPATAPLEPTAWQPSPSSLPQHEALNPAHAPHMAPEPASQAHAYDEHDPYDAPKQHGTADESAPSAPGPDPAPASPEAVPATPPARVPTSLPTDVMLVGPRMIDTQPDGIKLPDTNPDGIKIVGVGATSGDEDDQAERSGDNGAVGDDGEDGEAYADDRAEDPDAGDDDSETPPPFGQYRSSPTPPRG
jgi:hypothetical protein